MKVPWGKIGRIVEAFSCESSVLVGSLSFEERCCSVPLDFGKRNCIKKIILVNIQAEKNLYKDLEGDILGYKNGNRSKLVDLEGKIEYVPLPLLASVEELLKLADQILEEAPDVVLDVSALPKRVFCFLIKRLVRDRRCKSLLVCYTEAGCGGYVASHLAEEPLPCDSLPGFSAPFQNVDTPLIVSVGFETLGLETVLESQAARLANIRLITPFPPNGEKIRRVWRSVESLMPEGRRIITKNEIEAIAAYDVEQVLLQIEKWADARCGVQLAPFGPKPHAVAMALYASQGVDMPLIYAQPRLYNPPYSFGSGDCYGYVVKWDFIAAYDRKDMGPAR